MSGFPILYYPPGSYDRAEHPGLSYEWELVLEDRSRMWNRHMRDFQGCYDALRVHMGEIPASIGLTRVEVHLSDPIFGKEMEMDDLAFEQINGMEFEANVRMPLPRTEPAHPDLARVKLRCFVSRDRPDHDVICRVYPEQGNSGSLPLDAAIVQALAATAGHMSRQSRAYQYFWIHREQLPNIPYLYPMLSDGNPVGPGPCLEVTRAGQGVIGQIRPENPHSDCLHRIKRYCASLPGRFTGS